MLKINFCIICDWEMDLGHLADFFEFVLVSGGWGPEASTNSKKSAKWPRSISQTQMIEKSIFNISLHNFELDFQHCVLKELQHLGEIHDLTLIVPFCIIYIAHESDLFYTHHHPWYHIQPLVWWYVIPTLTV